MPSVSEKQRNFMAAVAHNPAFAKKAGVPQSVGKDFNQADKGRKFAKGGDTMATKDDQFDDDVKRVKSGLYMNKGEDRVYSRERGLGPSMAAQRLEKRGVDIKGLAGNRANDEDLGSYKKGGKVKKMNTGGYASGGMAHEDVKMDKKMMQKAVNKHEGRLHKGEPMTKLSKGGVAASKMGSVRTAAPSRDGIAMKGKTKGTMIAMKRGGKC